MRTPQPRPWGPWKMAGFASLSISLWLASTAASCWFLYQLCGLVCRAIGA